MIRAALIPLFSLGCLPTLPDRQCYGNDECVSDQVCRSGTCAARQWTDAQPFDAKIEDARPDGAEPSDASDAGSEDAALDAGPCVPGCADAVTLRECNGSAAIDTACDWGCSTSGAAHCAGLAPSGGAVTPDDLIPDPQRASVAIVLATTLDSDDGSIEGIRPAGTGIINGIGFVVRNEVGIFLFDELSVLASLTLRGRNSVALVSSNGITIEGHIDAQGDCAGTNAGPGGGAGGAAESPGAGAGGGATGAGVHDDCSGGSGGGHGARGGAGGSSPSQASPALGATFGDAEISMLIGGSGGAGGGGPISGPGGGGGGAIQLAAARTISISGGINAGGCGGSGAMDDGGGGGGSGGTILLEAYAIEIASGAILAVNGGGGGAGDGGGSGEPGQWSAAAAAGGSPNDSGGAGGTGGAAAALTGDPGGGELNGGGGGGGVGRIRMNTSTGTVAVDANAIVSPRLDAPMTTATRGAASAL